MSTSDCDDEIIFEYESCHVCTRSPIGDRGRVECFYSVTFEIININGFNRIPTLIDMIITTNDENIGLCYDRTETNS
jgi:hypothetical protein